MSKALLLCDALEGAWLENQRDVSVDEIQDELRRLDALMNEQAQEIERLMAQRVPLTDEQIARRTGEDVLSPESKAEAAWCRGFRDGVRFAEAAHEITNKSSAPKFQLGDRVYKKSGSAWSGRVVGTYSTTLTPEGYAVESDAHPGSVQIYPAAALERKENP